MTPSQADWKPSLQQGELRGHCKDQGQEWHVSRGRSDSQEEARVQSAASLLHSHQEARLVVAEQGLLSAARLSQLRAVRSEEVPAVVQGWQNPRAGNAALQGCKQGKFRLAGKRAKEHLEGALGGSRGSPERGLASLVAEYLQGPCQPQAGPGRAKQRLTLCERQKGPEKLFLQRARGLKLMCEFTLSQW